MNSCHKEVFATGIELRFQLDSVREH
eukprot:gene26750-biopygen17288